ncbi:MAG: hypothetical protein K9W42_11565 [Candidatus Heimdallarchaeota archaeon]|nr:hypothetical protein [Candidatus Heimdallarchaeota archaeon]
MATETDYFKEYMQTASGEPTLIVRGVLLFFKSLFSNEELDNLEKSISNQKTYTLENTKKILDENNVDEETARQIIALLNKKFKEAIEKKELTTKKLDFIRSIKKKH